MGTLGEQGKKTRAQLNALATNASKKTPEVLLESIGGGAETVLRKKPERVGSLEKLIRRDRHALLIQNDTWERFDVPAWIGPLEGARARVEQAILAVGRVEYVVGDRGMHLGSGWLVAPNLVVTNRHVADEFAYQKSDGSYAFRTHPGTSKKYRARIDFKEESGVDAVKEFAVKNVLYIAPEDGPDVAILEIAPVGTEGQAQPSPLALFDGAAEDGQLIAVIGYPAEDPYEKDQDLMAELFGGEYSVKRLSPGTVMRNPTKTGLFEHDCATLGGSSGSAVIDLATGAVLGLHFSGVSGESNWAVHASEVSNALATINGASVPEKARFEAKDLDAIDEGVKGGTRPASYFDGRNGYNAAFLGSAHTINLPTATAARAGELAHLVGSSNESELRYQNFSTRQNRVRRLPWITAVNIDGNKLFAPKRANSWYRDGRLEAKHQVGNEVYTNSGFSRGHMVRRLDPVWGDDRDTAGQANLDTFTFTNACPQEQDAFNDKLWGDLEDLILERTDKDNIKVSVFTGPVFRDDDPFLDDVQIPMEFYKIVAWKQGTKLKAVGFVLSQSEFVEVERFTGSEYATYERRIADIGRAAGIDFGDVLKGADVNTANESANEAAKRFSRRVRSSEDIERLFKE